MKQHQRNIITILLVMVILVLIALVLYDYCRSMINVVPDEIRKWEEEKVDLQKLEDEYKNRLISEIIPKFQIIINDINTASEETIDDLRQKLLDLKLPARFKDMHVRLVLLLDLIKDDVREGDFLEQEEYQKMLDDIIGEYEWIEGMKN